MPGLNQEEGTQQKATAGALILDVLTYRTINNKFMLFVSHTVSGILLIHWQPQRTKTVSQAHVFFKLEFNMHLLL